MSKLTGKVAIVTGASKGIGAAIARGLAAEGAAVVVNYVSSPEDAERVVAQITAAGGRALAVQADVSQAREVQRLFAAASEAYGALDVLVNNAGVYAFVPLEQITEQEFYRQFDTNVLGVLLATQEAVKHFRADGGSVINISSIATTTTPPQSAIYTASKGAVDAITRVLARELASRHIRVNSINPGPVKTEGFRALEVDGQFVEQAVAHTALGRLGKPSDIAPLAVFLASPDSGWLTGETLAASGGLH